MAFKSRARRKEGLFRPALSPGIVGMAVSLALLTLTRSQAQGAGGEALLEASGVKGGVVVQLSPGDGKLIVELARGGNVLVHGLAADQAEVDAARRYILSQGLYGQVSVEKGDLKRLPYADDLVNLVVADRLPRAGLSLKEVMRVVCPNGVAAFRGVSEGNLKTRLSAEGLRELEVARKPGGWLMIRKPRPPEMDEWTQRGYNGARTYVSNDTALGHITGLRWLMGPLWPLGRYYQKGNAGMVSANGRIFYLSWSVPSNFNRSAIEWEKEYYLLARDAYNGLTLWSRPIKQKFNSSKNKKYQIYWHSPGEWQLAENLAAIGDRVFTVIENNVVALDAATGEILVTFEKNYFPKNILYEDKILILVGHKLLRTYEPTSRKLIWKKDLNVTDCVAGDGQLFCLTNDYRQLVCLDLETGNERWKSSTASWYKGSHKRPFFYKNAVLVFPYGKKSRSAHVVSAKEGKHLWSHSSSGRICYLVDGLIWFQSRRVEGFNPLTGKVKRSFKTHVGWGCCPNAATERFIVGTRCAKTIDIKTGETVLFNARHPCATGLVPANGLVYSMPQGCARCAMGSIRGYVAIAPDDPAREKELEIKDADRLQKGPAYGKATNPKSEIQTPVGATGPKSDWPIYRHDNQRSCLTKNTVPLELEPLWQTQVDDQKRPYTTLALEWLAHRVGGDRLTAPTVAEGKVFVSIGESHRVAALDPKTGKILWTFTAGGLLDTPPTIYRGLCFFGSYDGWVYCLRAQDGALVWRFNAAFKEKKFMAFGQLESVSPVVGGVLIEKGIAFFVSGRAKNTEGGMSFYAVNPLNGKLIKAQQDIGGKAEPDVLVSNGSEIRMASSRHRLHGFGNNSQGGAGHLYVVRPLLNRAWRYHGSRNTHLDKKDMNKFFFWGHVGQVTIGDPLDKRTFAYKFVWNTYLFPRSLEEFGGSLNFWKAPGNVPARPRNNSKDVPANWSVAIPHPSQIESLVLAGEVLFAAGPFDKYHREKGGFLRAYDPEGGKLLREWKLEFPPVADGLAVAGGRLYIATQDGKVLCFGKG